MTDSSQTTCGACRFWAGVFGHSHAAECRRRAPVMAIAQPGSFFGGASAAGARLFPLTQHADWCGEFEPIQLGPGKGADHGKE